MAAVAVGAALLSLAACGGSGGSTAGPSAATSSPTAKAGPGGLPVAQTVREGQPFTVTYDYSTGTTATWKLTLDTITCGSGSIFDPKVLAADAASVGEPPPATPQPEAGMKFCLVKFSDTNESISNQNWQASSEATVNVGPDAYQSDSNGPGYDAEQAYMQEAQPHSQTSDFGINPGVSAVSWAVYEIPAGAKATSVSVEASAYSGGPQVLILAPESTS